MTHKKFKNGGLQRTLLSLLMAAAMVMGLCVPAWAAPGQASELPDLEGKLVAFQASDLGYNYYTPQLDSAWVTLDPSTVYYDFTTEYPDPAEYKGIEVIEQMDFGYSYSKHISAAVGIDGYVFFTYDEISDSTYTLYRAKLGDAADATPVVELGSIDSNGFKVMEEILDMDYSDTDKRIYAIDNGSGNAVWSIDPLTGHAELAARVYVDGGNPFANLVNIAIDPEDGETFYGTWVDHDDAAGTTEVKLERWKLKDAVQGEEGYGKVDSTTVGVLKLITPKYDELTDLVEDETGNLCFLDGQLYMANCKEGRGTFTSAANRLYKVDKQTAQVDYANENDDKGAILFFAATAMFEMKTPGLLNPTEEVSSFTLDRQTVELHVGGNVDITYKLDAWTLTDKTISWESSESGVATVDTNGHVTAVGVGETVITATPKLAEDKARTCTVTVTPMPDMNVTAAMYNGGQGGWGFFNVNTLDDFTVEKAVAKYYGGGYIGNHTLLVQDGEKAYLVDADTFETHELGELTFEFSDAAESPKLAAEGYEGKTYAGLYLGKQPDYWGDDESYLFLLDPENLSSDRAYPFYGATYDDPGEPILAVIAYAGKTTYKETDFWGNEYEYPDSDLFYAVTEDGSLYEMTLYDTEDDFGETYLTTLPGVNLEGASDGDGTAYASMTMDSATGYLILTYSTDGGDLTVWAIDPENAEVVFTDSSNAAGPVTALYAYDRATDITVRVKPGEVELLEGDVFVPEAEVILYSQDSTVTWSTSDTSVAAVDAATGAVTAMGAGTATITATTAEAGRDGENASASLMVNVVGKLHLDTNAQINGQLSDGRWVTMPLRDVADVTELGRSDPLYGGGMHDGLIYGNDKPLDGVASDLFTLDPENGFVKLSSQKATNWEEIGGYFGLVDAATAPAMDVVIGDVKGTAFGLPMLLTYNTGALSMSAGRGILLLKDIETVGLYGFVAYSDVPQAAAVTYDRMARTAEMYDFPEDTMNEFCEVFYVTDGTALYTSAWIPTVDDTSGEIKISYTMATAKVADLDRVFEDNTALSMQAVDLDLDGFNDGLVIAYSGDGVGRLFYIDLTRLDGDTCHVEYLGAVEGAARVTSLYPAEPIPDTPVVPDTPVSPPPAASDPGQTQPGGQNTGVQVTVPKDADAEDTVTADVEVNAAADSASAEEIKIKNESESAVQVEIPVTNVTPGTVAVIVRPDGTEEVIRDCAVTENGVVLDVEDDVTVKIVDNTQTFSDVEPVNHWAADAVEFVAARGLFSGTGDGKFSPDTPMSRAMAATVLYVLAYEPEPEAAASFADVFSDAYYAKAVAWAQRENLIAGYTDGSFGPNDDVQREQLVTILYGYAKRQGYVTGPTGSLEGYSDAAAVSPWAVEAMSWAVENGLIGGVGGNLLAPKSPASRGQVATIFMQFCQKIIH